jgi:diadenosine tetraphosphate (Ap4A) HIT family hydrolase
MYSNQQMLITFYCLFQDDEYVAFPDIKPAAKHHYLIVTREHIRDVKVLTAEHKPVGK